MIAQKKQYVSIVEITKTYGTAGFLSAGSEDSRAGKQLQPRLRPEYYRLNLAMPCTSNQDVFDEFGEDADVYQKMKIITGRLQGGHTAFVATSMGLIRWQFLMDRNLTNEEHNSAQTSEKS